MKALVAWIFVFLFALSGSAAVLSVDASTLDPTKDHELPIGFRNLEYPIVGEMSYAETPPSEWNLELAKMKAAGIEVVVSPVVWRYHEPTQGVRDFKGPLDVGAFAAACEKAELLLVLRPAIGSEPDMPRGGAPDWWTGSGDLVQAIRPFLAGLGGSLAGSGVKWTPAALQWGLDAPVTALEAAAKEAKVGNDEMVTMTVGVPAPPAQSAPYPPKSNLKDTAMPLKRVLIVSADPSAPSTAQPGTFAFRSVDSPEASEMLDVGSLSTYLRRPFLSSTDVGAAALVELGSGTSMLWYEHFHGGTRLAPTTARTPLEFANVQPLLNDDAQSPISSAGELRGSYARLKEINLFAHDFGMGLNGMPAFLPAPLADGKGAPMAWSVRSDGKAGFLFISNYGREAPAVDRGNVQFAVKLKESTVTIPSLPTRIPAQTTAIWPINMMLGGARLQYATAQPLCRLGSWFVFFGVDGVPAEFMFDRSTLSADSNWHMAGIDPDLTTTFDVTSKGGLTAHVLVIKQAQAALAWRVTLAGRPHLVLTGPLTCEHGTLHVALSPGNPTPLLVMPALDLGRPSTPKGPFALYMLPAGPQIGALPAINLDPKFDTTASTEDLLHGRPPSGEEYARAQKFSMRLPPEDINPENNATLVIRMEADAGRVYLGGHLISDAFYDGSSWRIPVNRFLPQIATEPLTFRLIGAKPNASLGIDRTMNPWFGSELPTAPIRIRLANELTHYVDLSVAPSGG